MYNQTRTVAAISTGQAPGGIGVVRISGPQALAVGERVFRARSGRPLTGMAGYSAAVGGIYSAEGEKLDDCVALVFRGPKSYTGEDVVELSCHGGLYLTRRVLSEVLTQGADPAGPGEFTRQAFLNGKLDLAQAESVMELIGAGGEQAARLAQAGSSGALSKRIAGIISDLEKLAVHLAAWADFPEEDVDEVSVEETEKALDQAEQELAKLLTGFDKAKVYREGLRTVIVGRPNVGKSTLMNLLSGRERSIVTPHPGTTRDVVEEPVSVGGIPLLLADTAGLRESSDPVEKIGVAVARERLGSAQLVLAVFDGSRELGREDLDLMEELKTLPVIAVVNKSDLEHRMDTEKIGQALGGLVRISAAQGSGLKELEDMLVKKLGGSDFHPVDGELFTQRQQAAVQRAWESLRQGRDALALTLDAVTVCVENALDALFELTGQKVSEQVVDQVFEQFCVGK